MKQIQRQRQRLQLGMLAKGIMKVRYSISFVQKWFILRHAYFQLFMNRYMRSFVGGLYGQFSCQVDSWTLHWTRPLVTFAVDCLAGGPAWETKERGCEGGQWSREELCFHIRTDWDGAMLEITAGRRPGPEHTRSRDPHRSG